MEWDRIEQNRTEQNRTEQNRTEQSRKKKKRKVHCFNSNPCLKAKESVLGTLDYNFTILYMICHFSSAFKKAHNSSI